MSTTAPILQLEALATGYRKGRRERLVSSDIHLELPAGSLTLVMGPNGTGKSTLLHTIAGIIPPLAGSIRLVGKPLAEIRLSELAQHLSLVLTRQADTSEMSVREIVAIGRHPYTGFLGRLTEHDEAVIHDALTACHLEQMTHRLYGELSDGERQRVMIARALAQETSLILLDEPTAHLDLPSRLEIILMLRELAHQRGKGILISTHELDLALSWGDQLWLLDREGHIIQGTPEDLALSGELERIFASGRLHFDLAQGGFTITSEQAQPITLRGEGPRRLWTTRALQRTGYTPTDQTTPLVITIHPESWQLQHPGGESWHPSLASLLSVLQTLPQS